MNLTYKCSHFLMAFIAAAITLSCKPAAAGVPIVIYSAQTGAGSSHAFSPSFGCAAGNAVVAFLRFDDNLTFTSIADGANGLWNPTAMRDSGTHRGLSASKVLTTALTTADTITITLSGSSNYTSVQILCVPGIMAADAAASAVQSGTSIGSAGNVTFATTPVTLVAGLFISDQRFLSGPSGWTLLSVLDPSPADDYNTIRTYFRTGDVTSPVTLSYTTGFSGQHIWSYHAFTESAAPPAAQQRMTTLGVGG